MGWFNRKKEDTYKECLELSIKQRDEEFQKLLPELSYTEQVELALNVSRDTVSCGPVLQFVNEFTIKVLEKEYESLTGTESPK